jgi:hypothetical protein
MRMNVLLSIIIVALCGSRLVAADESKSTKDKDSSDQASARKETISFNQLPERVQKTVSAAAGGANVENVQKLTKNGRTCYQASFDQKNMKGKLTVSEDGSLLQYQQAEDLALVAAVPTIPKTGMSLTDLPEAARKTIKEQAGSNDVGDVSKKTEGTRTLYHAAFNDAGVHTSLLVDEDGKLVGKSEETALFLAPVEEVHTMALSAAPQAVQKTVRKYASPTSVTDIDKGTWNGKTAYTVMVEKNGSSRCLVISESGELLGHQTATGAPAEAQTGKEQEQPQK